MRVAGPVASDEEARHVVAVLRSAFAAEAALRAARRARERLLAGADPSRRVPQTGTPLGGTASRS